MIRVFSSGRYSFNDWNSLATVLSSGLREICVGNCDDCTNNYVCREISQAITYCDKKSNEYLYKKGVKNV